MNELWRASWWFTHAYGASCSRRSFLQPGHMFCAKHPFQNPSLTAAHFAPLPTTHAQHCTTGFAAQACHAHAPSPAIEKSSPRSMCGESAPVFFLCVCVCAHPWPPMLHHTLHALRLPLPLRAPLDFPEPCPHASALEASASPPMRVTLCHFLSVPAPLSHGSTFAAYPV